MYYFSAWGRLGYKQLYFINFWTPISPKLIEVGIEIWYAGGCVGLQIVKQELISRLDSRTLPLEPRHRCTSSVLSTCLRNDVLASCFLTKHTPDDVTHALQYDLSIGPIFNDLERLDFKVAPLR